jgi:hypothetical protein
VRELVDRGGGAGADGLAGGAQLGPGPLRPQRGAELVEGVQRRPEMAAGAGASFVGNGSNGASLTMALATAVAMFSYVAAIFALPMIVKG